MLSLRAGWELTGGCVGGAATTTHDQSTTDNQPPTHPTATTTKTTTTTATTTANRAQCLDLHSRLSQTKRDRAAAQFASSDGVLLFASDVIARGLDFPDVTLVVQVGLTDATQYEHRGE